MALTKLQGFVKGESAPIFSRTTKTTHKVIINWATQQTECLYHYERLDNHNREIETLKTQSYVFS